MTEGIELLAPAGNWEAFLAAVENGADAVYLGGKLFNARQFAGNFNTEELKEAVYYAHVRGVKLYLTMNTLVADREVEEAIDFASWAYFNGIDGVIVQDLGFAGILRKLFPDIHLHASTQMTIYNIEGCNVLEDLGFKRVVLARELPIREIRRIVKDSSLEIEVFIHGALCISYSGQCLMSSIIGGRSGNRGRCAQPCRLPYQLTVNNYDKHIKSNHYIKTEGRYILSPKDMCSIYMLKDLIESGVKSFKIEGRMKTPEYVAVVVQTYRKYIDLIMDKREDVFAREISVDKNDVRNLTQVFNRGGFTNGYLEGKPGREMMSYNKPKNQGIYIGNVQYYNSRAKMVGIKLKQQLSVGDGIEIWNGQKESPGNVVSRIFNGRSNMKRADAGDTVEAGYLNGEIYKGNPVYKTSDRVLNAKARSSFTRGSNRKTGLKCSISIKRGTPVVMKVWDSRGNEVEGQGGIPEEAVNKPLTEERVVSQLTKTGETPFKFDDISVEIEKGLSIPTGQINKIRRNTLEQMEIKRGGDNYCRKISQEIVERKKLLKNYPGNSRKTEINNGVTSKPRLSAFFYKWDENISYETLAVDRFYFPVMCLRDNLARDKFSCMRESGRKVFVWLPSITRGVGEDVIKDIISRIDNKLVDGILIGNIGSLKYFKTNSKIKKAGDYSLNVFNSWSVEELYRLKLNSLTLSTEMTLNQVSSIKGRKSIELEMVIYGRITLMTTENCIVGNVAGCAKNSGETNGKCKNESYWLKDRRGIEFPVLCDKMNCRNKILNSNVMFIPGKLRKVINAGIDVLRLNFYDETPEEVEEIIDMHSSILSNDKDVSIQYGKLIDNIKSKGYNNGHLFRGV